MTVRSERGEGSLIHNAVLFSRVLRGLGLDVNPGRMVDFIESLSWLDLSRRDDVFYAARCLLVHRRSDLDLFDRAFEMFWTRPPSEWGEVELPGRLLRKSERRPLTVPPPPSAAAGPSPTGAKDEDDSPVRAFEVQRSYSDRDRLRQTDFSELSESEIQEIEQAISHLVWQLGSRRSRRYRPRGGPSVDFRRSLRRNLRFGGEPLDIPRRRRIDRPRPITVIADISGSMERYTRLLLHFLYSLTHGLGHRVEGFVFGTRLTRLSPMLRERRPHEALSAVSNAVVDWAGGTRIGASLREFNLRWARRVLGGGSVVLLISDGWDRGDPKLVDSQMARLHRSCYRLIWLNPLLGAKDYEPLTRGMMAALPHVDDFLPVHNLASLEALAHRLARLDARRARTRRGAA